MSSSTTPLGWRSFFPARRVSEMTMASHGGTACLRWGQREEHLWVCNEIPRNVFISPAYKHTAPVCRVTLWNKGQEWSGHTLFTFQTHPLTSVATLHIYYRLINIYIYIYIRLTFHIFHIPLATHVLEQISQLNCAHVKLNVLKAYIIHSHVL